MKKFKDTSPKNSSKDDIGHYPLLRAIQMKDMETTAYLLMNTHSPNAIHSSKSKSIWNNYSPLLMAYETQNEKAVKLLLKHKADINVIFDASARIRGSHIKFKNHTPTFKKLHGYAPLTYAVAVKDEKMVKYLLDHNADTNMICKVQF